MRALSSGDGKTDACEFADGVVFQVFQLPLVAIHDVEKRKRHAHGIGAADFIGDRVALEIGAVFEQADKFEDDENQDGGEEGRDVEAGAAGHADGSDGPDSGGGGKPAHAVALMQDESSAEKADALDNVRGDLAAIGARVSGDQHGEKREHGRTEADEHVRAHAGRTMMQLAIDADGAAQPGGEQKTSRSPAGDEHLLNAAVGQHVPGLDGEDHFLLIVSPAERPIPCLQATFRGSVPSLVNSGEIRGELESFNSTCGQAYEALVQLQ